jgi:diguanylate cyclase (GGDEF)-like protein
VPESETHSPTPAPESGPASRSGTLAGRLRALRLLAQGRKSVWTVLAALLVLAGVLAAVLVAREVARSEAGKARLTFHLASAEIASTLRIALQREEDLVVNASAFITRNPSASAADFDRWAESVHTMQRYPELQDLGLVTLVPASRLAAFEAHIAANPLRPLGPQSLPPKESFQILPPGKRPYYCFAVAGLERSAAAYIPAGVDYCAAFPQLILARDFALTDYAPLVNGNTATFGVQTPVYRGRVVPATVAARRRAFVGWLGELLLPGVLLKQALEGHPNVAVDFRYDSRLSHVRFTSGKAPAGAQSTTIALQVGREAGLGNSHEGWTMRTFGAQVSGGVFGDKRALTLLIGGIVLSLVLGLLFFVLVTGRMRALSLVRKKTRELAHQAHHDPLTGLPNRALVLDRAEQMLARVAREPRMLAGALFVDVDGFKQINDSLGHAAGDQVLRVVGERLQSAVRAPDTVGRIGGDEFIVLAESSAAEARLDLLAQRLTEALREPVELDDGPEMISVTASIGVTSGHYATPDALLHDADLALYSAKAAGRDRYTLFEASLPVDAAGQTTTSATS